jgi:hypothetical protein
VRVGFVQGLTSVFRSRDSDPDQRTYKVGTLQLLPQSENVFLIYKSGWHAPEFAPDNSDEWQWTQKSGVVTFKNPRKDVTLYLEMDARADLFPRRSRSRSSWPASPSRRSRWMPRRRSCSTIPITAAELGADDMVELRLDVDKTFVLAQLGKGHRQPRAGRPRVAHLRGAEVTREAVVTRPRRVVARGLLPRVASADIVRLTNGATLSVKSRPRRRRHDGDLVLRSGGENAHAEGARRRRQRR